MQSGYLAVEERSPSAHADAAARAVGAARPPARWRRAAADRSRSARVRRDRGGGRVRDSRRRASEPADRARRAARSPARACSPAGASGSTRAASCEREIDDRQHELWHALSELEVAQAETVRRLSMAVEFRDEDTGAHIERIGRLSAQLADEIGLDPAFCARLSYAAPLHDVGKVAIPDAILLKPGPLTPAERAIVETHAEEGHRLLSRSSSSILDLAASVALSHHEKWDGSGYPRGLAGEEIPIEGRIVAVTDVFDALTSDRVYRKAYSKDEAIAMMKEQRGRHFDPILLDAFMELIGAARSDAARRAAVRSRGRRRAAAATPSRARSNTATRSPPRRR